MTIENQQDYTAALAKIETLWEAQLDSPEGQELDRLVSLVEEYEKVHFPMGSEEEGFESGVTHQGLPAEFVSAAKTGYLEARDGKLEPFQFGQPKK